MNNEKMNQIVDEVYENYVSTYENFEWTDDFCEKNLKDCGDQWDILSKEDFINNCKTDDEFSKTWGLRIEERELSFEEKFEYVRELTTPTTNKIEQILIALSIPTKLITITYNDIKTEIYE